MKITSLAAYSAASGLLLGLASEASGQMTYYNIDPDATVFGDIDYPIDLNLDGIPEMTMHGNRWWTFTSGDVFSSQQISFFNYAEIATSAGPLQLYAGDIVNADLDFNGYNQSFFYGYNWDGALDIDAGTSWINNDSYIGMRFDVDGNNHYGWIRVRLHQTDVNDMPGLIGTPRQMPPHQLICMLAQRNSLLWLMLKKQIQQLTCNYIFKSRMMKAMLLFTG